MCVFDVCESFKTLLAYFFPTMNLTTPFGIWCLSPPNLILQQSHDHMQHVADRELSLLMIHLLRILPYVYILSKCIIWKY